MSTNEDKPYTYEIRKNNGSGEVIASVVAESPEDAMDKATRPGSTFVIRFGWNGKGIGFQRATGDAGKSGVFAVYQQKVGAQHKLTQVWCGLA